MADVAVAQPDAETVTIDRVRVACRTLPEPAWNRIVPDHPAPRRAATLIPLIDVGGHAAVVITKRAGTLDHGGDWVFPGGRVDDDDASHRDAARREAAEELGIDPGRIDVVGQLTTHGPIVSGFVIEVFVGLLDQATTFAPPPDEVTEVAVVRIDDLLETDAHSRGAARVVRRRDAYDAETFGLVADLSNLRHYHFGNDEHLWGLQADILFELLHHVTSGIHQF